MISAVLEQVVWDKKCLSVMKLWCFWMPLCCFFLNKLFLLLCEGRKTLQSDFRLGTVEGSHLTSVINLAHLELVVFHIYVPCFFQNEVAMMYMVFRIVLLYELHAYKLCKDH